MLIVSTVAGRDEMGAEGIVVDMAFSSQSRCEGWVDQIRKIPEAVVEQ